MADAKVGKGVRLGAVNISDQAGMGKPAGRVSANSPIIVIM